MSTWWDDVGKLIVGIVVIAGLIGFGVWRLCEYRERLAKELIGCTAVAAQADMVIYECPGGMKVVR